LLTVALAAGRRLLTVPRGVAGSLPQCIEVQKSCAVEDRLSMLS
jgi:hypothetical protein